MTAYKQTTASILLAAFFMVALMPSCLYAEDNGITIGLIPEENIFRMLRKYRPLGEYLTEAMGTKVRFTILSRYADIIDRFASRKLDGAFFGIFASVLTQRQLGTEPIARPDLIEGGSTAHSYLFTRKNSGIHAAKDMKGKRFAFVDKATATGYVYALAYLRDNGIGNPNSFIGETIFTGSHDASVYTVLSGKADVGVVKGRIMDNLAKLDPTISAELQILSKSAALPDTTLCLRGDLPDHLKKRMTSVLLAMHENPKGREILKGIGAKRFVKAESSDQAEIERLASRAGINPRTFTFR